MMCSEINQLLDQGASGADNMPSEASRHLEECGQCRRLLAIVRSSSSPGEMAEGLHSRVHGAILQDLAPVKPVPGVTARVVRFLAAYLLLSLGGIALMGAAGAGRMTFLQAGGIAAILLAGAVFLAVSLSLQMVPGSPYPVVPGRLMAGVLSAFLLAATLLLPWSSDGSVWATGVRCAGFGLSGAIPSALLLWLLAHRGAILSPSMLGASVGLLAGLVGATVLHFSCVMIEAQHHLLWHAGVPAVSMALGFLIGKQVELRSGIRR